MKLPDLTIGVSSPGYFVGSEIPRAVRKAFGDVRPKQKFLRIAYSAEAAASAAKAGHP